MNRMQRNYSSVLLIMITNFILPVVLSSNAAFATKPEQCPSAAALQNSSIQKEDLIEITPPRTTCCTTSGFPYTLDGEWGIKQYINNFGTNGSWSLGLHNVIANNREEAFPKMINGLATLKFASGPYSYMGRWSCRYYSYWGDVGVSYLS